MDICRITGSWTSILKNYILNKKLLGWLPLEVVFLLLAILLSTFVASSVVWAHAETSTQPQEEGQEQAVEIDSTDLITVRPYLVKIIDGESEEIISTPYQDARDILKSAGIQTYSEDKLTLAPNANRDEHLLGYVLEIDRATPVKLSLYGNKLVKRTHASTVGDVLSENGVVLGLSDKVEPKLDTRLTPGVAISVFKVGTESITIEEDLPFSRNYIDDDTLDSGAQVVTISGTNGRAKVTYEVTYYDGVEAARRKTASTTLKEPVTEVVRRGPVDTNGPLSWTQIQFLGNCEAGMNPTRNSGNGYYGAFQFSAGTWNAMGTGYARADLAPLDVQVAAVQQLLSRSSIYGQFPGCANAMVAAGLL